MIPLRRNNRPNGAGENVLSLPLKIRAEHLLPQFSNKKLQTMYLLLTVNWGGVLITCLALLVIAYLIALLTNRGSFIKTKRAGTGVIEADHLYYLPTAYLTLKATAKVVVEKDAATAVIQKATLAELAFEPTVQIVPDTENAFVVNYKSNPFSKDEMDISINAAGLLEGINLSADDRIAEILSKVAEAPKVVLTGEQAAQTNAFTTEETKTLTVETKEYTNNFIILMSEIRAGAATRSWVINVDGNANNGATTADASFTLTFITNASTPLAAGAATEYDGVATRPVHTAVMEMRKAGNPTGPADAAYPLVLPDESSLLIVPVKRSAFVAKTYGIKMTNGLLSANKINKPSELEGFIGIPVKIAKAFLSIPAQLFQFKLEKINRQTTLETKQLALLKAEALAKKERIGAEAGLLQAQLEAEKSLVTAQTALLTARQALEAAGKK